MSFYKRILNCIIVIMISTFFTTCWDFSNNENDNNSSVVNSDISYFQEEDTNSNSIVTRDISLNCYEDYSYCHLEVIDSYWDDEEPNCSWTDEYEDGQYLCSDYKCRQKHVFYIIYEVNCTMIPPFICTQLDEDSIYFTSWIETTECRVNPNPVPDPDNLEAWDYERNCDKRPCVFWSCLEIDNPDHCSQYCIPQ